MISDLLVNLAADLLSCVLKGHNKYWRKLREYFSEYSFSLQSSRWGIHLGVNTFHIDLLIGEGYFLSR